MSSRPALASAQRRVHSGPLDERPGVTTPKGRKEKGRGKMTREMLICVGFFEASDLWRTCRSAEANALRYAEQQKMSDEDADKLSDSAVVLACVLVGCGWPI
jgi:hypothetical protein